MSKSKERSRGVSRWWKPVLALALPFMVGAACFYSGVGPVDIAPASRDLESAVAEYRKLGWPLEAKDFDPPVSPSEDGTPTLRLAVAAIGKPYDDASLTKAINYAKAQKWAEVDKLLKPFDKAFSLAEQASKYARIRLHVNLDSANLDGANYEFVEDLATTGSLINSLCVSARLRSAEGSTDIALKNLTVAWRLSNLIAQQPSNELMGMGYESEVLTAVRRCAAALSHNPEALTRLDAILNNPCPSYKLEPLLWSSAYDGIALSRNLDLYGGMGHLERMVAASSGAPTTADERTDEMVASLQGKHADPPSPRLTGLPPNMLQRAYLDRHLRFWITAAKFSNAHPTDPAAVGKYIDDLQTKMLNNRSMSDYMEVAIQANFHATADILLEVEAAYISTKALLSTLLVCAKTGRMPKTISEIPGTWIDPFTGKPLLVKSSSKGIRVYSVGPNLKDDGGISQFENRSLPREYDVAASYPPVEKL